MRIGIDARAWQWEGIGRYIRSVVPALAAQRRGHQYFVCTGAAEYEAVAQELAEIPGDVVQVVKVEGSYYSWREQLILPRQLARLRADLWHFTHFNVPVWFRAPYVVTIHDAIRFVFPGEHQQSLHQQVAYEYVFQRAVQRARAIIVVSRATGDDLTALPIRVRPMTAIYEGVAERFWEPVLPAARQAVREWLGVTDPYLLFVGVWMNHKNIRRLLEAFQVVRRQRARLTLVLAGRPKQGSERVDQMVRQLGLATAVRMPGFVPEPLLPALYAEAAAFVFPSLYEGFGLPVLEAQAVGVPVVASNVTSLPELLGEAVTYVNPESVLDIARGIERALTNPESEFLIHLGQQQARHFSWTETARRHVEVYEQAVKSSFLRG